MSEFQMSQSAFESAVWSGKIVHVSNGHYMEAESVTNPLSLQADAHSKNRPCASNVKRDFGSEVAGILFRACEALDRTKTRRH